MFAGLFVGIAERVAQSALMTSPFGGILKAIWGFLGKIPWQVYAVLFGALALWLGVKWHGHEVHKTWQSGYNQAIADIKAREAKKVAPLKEAKAVGDASMVEVNKGVKKNYDTGNHHIDSNVADLFSMYAPRGGPGANAQRGVSGATGAGGTHPAGAPAADGLAENTAGEPVIVAPAGQLITRAGISDRDYIALKAWEDWYTNYKTIYDDWAAKAAKVSQSSH